MILLTLMMMTIMMTIMTIIMTILGRKGDDSMKILRRDQGESLN